MKWPVTIDIRVPWRDLDGAGHLNNAVMFSYLEAARVDAYYRAKGLDPEKLARLPIDDIDIILARVSCEFRSPAVMGELLEVATWPTHVGMTSFTLAYKVTEKTTGRLVAEGDSVQVCFDYKGQRKKAMPESLRAALTAGVAP